MSPSETISPTAHYTGYVWARNGLSHPALQTLEGRLLFESVRPAMIASRVLGGPSLETYLLARHRAIDALLEQAIEDGITQVIEIASGLSPRGWRFVRRHGVRLTYVEADLPNMTARKRRALEQIGSPGEHHRVESVDALKDEGPSSLATLADSLDPEKGLAIITEGLLGYLDHRSVASLWHRFARALQGFSAGRYISDLHLRDVQRVEVRAFRLMLSAFVRAWVPLAHFDDPREAEAALRQAGFKGAHVQRAADLLGEPSDRGSRLAHVLTAKT